MGGIASPTAAGDSTGLDNQRGRNARARIDRRFTAGHSDSAGTEASRALAGTNPLPKARSGLRSKADRSVERRSITSGAQFGSWSSFFHRLAAACRLHVSLGKRAFCILKVRRGLQLC